MVSKIEYFERVQNIARLRGGECLSAEYVNSIAKLDFKCKNGHVWSATSNKIQQDRWCSECRRGSINEFKHIAQKKGGMCDGQYVNMFTHLNFVCKYGHTWQALPVNIKNGTWCPYCAGRKLTIVDFKCIAKKCGGICLSKKYLGAHRKLKFKCADGHVWQALAKHIRAGHWCPSCKYKGESFCRKVFELIFNESFPKFRADWLKNNDGKFLELDGYCSNLGVAFEHQGIQHYKHIPFFRNHNPQNDLIKQQLCSDRGIKLIKVPSLGTLLKLEDLSSYLSGVFNSNNINVTVLQRDIESIKFMPNKITGLNNLVKCRGGRCVTNIYLGVNNKIKWECKNGHTWLAPACRIKSGSWCPFCAGVKLDIKYINSFFDNLKCISLKYEAQHKLRWQCEICLSIWDRTWRNLGRNNTCPSCKHIHKKTSKQPLVFTNE